MGQALNDVQEAEARQGEGRREKPGEGEVRGAQEGRETALRSRRVPEPGSQVVLLDDVEHDTLLRSPTLPLVPLLVLDPVPDGHSAGDAQAE